MHLIHTNGKNNIFISLCSKLDQYLDKINGIETQKTIYNTYNKLADLDEVIIIFENNIPLGCGAIKRYDSSTAELKRIYVCENARNKGIGKLLVTTLENTAKNCGYKRIILETGKLLLPAQALYKKQGFHIIDNYGQYANIPTSICMGKNI